MLIKIKLISNKKEKASELSGNKQNSSFLTDPDKIHNLLDDIKASSRLCTIHIDGARETFSSSILDLQLKNNLLTLGKLLPKYGNNLLVEKNQPKLSIVFGLIDLSFNLTQIKNTKFNGASCYQAAIPEQIYFPQRRSSLRIKPRSLDINFSGIASKKELVKGSVFDLSRHGMGINLSNNHTLLQRGDSIKQCRVTIDSHTLSFDTNIRSIKTNEKTKQIKIGCYLNNMTSRSQNKLDRYLASLERQDIRNRKR